ncbi:hypothetical protein SASPL_149841 [Salvia splendens]|uniref:Uncharacterized protein n=1 Tax=Salvia splendens TaxID=180675 RepID=A0A8X8W5J1_SALSN|nr:hypothetical protein SASPL_149841 [Salvia splendens]
MQPPHQHSMINLDELKAQIVEFNKLCLRGLERENIPLHNQLIRSILRNASCAKSPPPACHRDDSSKHASSQEIRFDGYHQKGLTIACLRLLVYRMGLACYRFHPRKLDLVSAIGENGDLNPPDCGIPVDMTGKRLLPGVHFKHPSGFLSVGLAELCLMQVAVDRLMMALCWTRTPETESPFVAMELNPRQLGEDWPLLLEKICTHEFEE